MAPGLSNKQWALSHLILLMLLGLALHQFFQSASRQLTLSFLDVGQGDAILIQTPEFKNILIDSGPDGKAVQELSKKLNFFNQKIDLFILTHPDLDHYGGALDIIQKYPIDKVMLTGVSSGSQLYLAFIEELRLREMSIIYPHADLDYRVGQDLYLDVLYPFKKQSLLGQEVKNKNDTSISILLRDGSGRPLALLTGDGEERQERDLLLSAQDISSPLFKLGHHGSKTSSSQIFLDAIGPDTVIVSAGKDNKFGHPHEEVLSRTEQMLVHSTADEGTLTFVLK